MSIKILFSESISCLVSQRGFPLSSKSIKVYALMYFNQAPTNVDLTPRHKWHSQAEPHSHSRRIFLLLVSQMQTLPSHLFQCSWSQRNILEMVPQTLWLMLHFMGLTPESRVLGRSCKFSRLFLKIRLKSLSQDWLYTCTAWGWSELLHKEFSFALWSYSGTCGNKPELNSAPRLMNYSSQWLQELPLHPEDAQVKLGNVQ